MMEREMDKQGKQVKPNVDFFSASVYRMLGFPRRDVHADFYGGPDAGGGWRTC